MTSDGGGSSGCGGISCWCDMIDTLGDASLAPEARGDVPGDGNALGDLGDRTVGD